MKRWTAFILSLMLLCLVASAQEQAGITFRGGTGEAFLFAPGSEYEVTDLFANFKDVLPGSQRTQSIQVENTSSMQVRIYLRIDPPKEEDKDFLHQMQISVAKGTSLLYDAPADEPSTLTEDTLLGTFKPGGQAELLVTLTVPQTLGNAYMGRFGTVPWTLRVEQLVAPTDTPKTGDWFQPALWAGAAGTFGILFLVLLFRKNKASGENA